MAKIETPESRREAKRRLLAQMADNPKDKRHGTYTGYQYGCRCERCVTAARDFFRKDKDRMKSWERKRLEMREKDALQPPLQSLLDASKPAIVYIHQVGYREI